MIFDIVGGQIMELRAWLKRNEEHLRAYSLEEVCNLAIAAGFDRISVAQYQIGDDR